MSDNNENILHLVPEELANWNNSLPTQVGSYLMYYLLERIIYPELVEISNKSGKGIIENKLFLYCAGKYYDDLDEPEYLKCLWLGPIKLPNIGEPHDRHRFNFN
jgi:hypothetical protein